MAGKVTVGADVVYKEVAVLPSDKVMKAALQNVTQTITAVFNFPN